MEEPSPAREESDPVEALARTEASWRALVDLASPLSPEILQEPGVTGNWSIKDLLNHIAFWDDNGAATARRLAAGMAHAGPDYRVVNDSEAAKRANQTLDQTMSELRAAHERLSHTLRDLEGFNPAAIAEDTYLHYEEHGAEIESWLARRKS